YGGEAADFRRLRNGKLRARLRRACRGGRRTARHAAVSGAGSGCHGPSGGDVQHRLFGRAAALAARAGGAAGLSDGKRLKSSLTKTTLKPVPPAIRCRRSDRTPASRWTIHAPAHPTHDALPPGVRCSPPDRGAGAWAAAVQEGARRLPRPAQLLETERLPHLPPARTAR